MSDDGYSDEDFEEYSDDGFEEDEPAPPPPQPAPQPAQMKKSPSFNARPPPPDPNETIEQAMARENAYAMRSVSPAPGERPDGSGSGVRPGSARPGSARPGSASRRNTPTPEFQVPDLNELQQEEAPARKSILPSRDQLQSDAQKEAAQKNRGRRDAVMAAIKLSEFAVDNMYDAMPMSVYDLMTMGRGRFASTAIASVQTNSEAREMETQTEEIKSINMRCQAPEDLGISREELEAPRTGRKAKTGRSLADSTLAADKERKLSAFVRSVGGVILQLLGEGSKSSEASAWAKATSSGCSLASSVIRLKSDASSGTAGRRVAAVAFSQDPSPRILVALHPQHKGQGAALEDHGLGARGMLCVWDPAKPAQPTHQLLCEGTPSCCCWASAELSTETYLVFAGMEEGGVCLWDLREPGMRYPAEEIQGSDVSALRRPTYSTEFMEPDEAVPGGTVAVAAVPRSKRTGEGRRTRGNLQLLSCGMWGDVTVWSVNEMSEADVGGTSEVDFGLRVGGRVRLLKTSAQPVRLGLQASRPAHLAPGIEVQRTFDICMPPRNNNEFITASDGGRILVGARYGEAPPPKEFKLEDHGILPFQSTLPVAAAVEWVNSVHFSPFFPEVFVAGYSNGTLAVFSIRCSLPVKVWNQVIPGEARKVRWSPARPGVLFCLDGSGALHIFDLSSSNPDTPSKVETFSGDVKAFEVSYRSEAVNDAHGQAEDGWVSPGAGRLGAEKGEHAFSIGFADGSIDIHLFNDEWGRAGPEEYMAVATLLGISG